MSLVERVDNQCVNLVLLMTVLVPNGVTLGLLFLANDAASVTTNLTGHLRCSAKLVEDLINHNVWEGQSATTD